MKGGGGYSEGGRRGGGYSEGGAMLKQYPPCVDKVNREGQ